MGVAIHPRARVVRSPRLSYRWTAELLWKLAMHRVDLRYKETVFGFGWIFLQPVALTLVFTYVFQRFAQISSGNAPYPLFSATGLVAWSLTALVVSQSAGAIGGYASLIRRVMLPRIVLPLSVVVAALADLGVMALLLTGLFVYYQVSLTWAVVWLPLVFSVHVLLLMGLCLLSALLNVFLRDAGHALPSLLQLWFFASPVFYPSSLVPTEFKMLARWNPMTGIIEGYRAALLFGTPPPMDLLGPAVIISLALLAFATALFWKFEGTVADML